MNAQTLIDILHLKPLPLEGGMHCQTYRSTDILSTNNLPDRYPAEEKPICTAIYYLLTDEPDSFSAFHTLPTDEIFHFYLGDPLEVNLLYPGGETRKITLGHDIEQGQYVQFVVPRGVWQGSQVAPGGKYSLIGTTMSPGWSDHDFILASRDDLLAQYPQEEDTILRLTRESAG
jgi:predicted cupin superfamily sugar epimerase